jgi:tetratricopeptide (TPR) repeat protein
MSLALLLLLAELYDVRGVLTPATRASVTLHGFTRPFEASTLSGPDGRFRFRNIQAGTYTLAVFIAGRGETDKTIEVGPSTADQKRRVELVVRLDENQMKADRNATVSMRQLSIPKSAREAYQQASRRLAKHDAAGAEAHLKRAVELAPQFTEAWNFLGTIEYQTKRYAEAESHFRRALEADPDAYSPLVNLGGVLVTLGHWDEALTVNQRAVQRRPDEALAQSQMGMTYFALNRFDLAEKYLTEAVRLDPSHFSHPQILLAEIYLRRGDKLKAADQLESFVRHHPDYPGAPKMRVAISEYRGSVKD